MMRRSFDAIVVGSGPAGAIASLSLQKKGLTTALLDIGFEDQKYSHKIPSQSFSEIHRSDLNQSFYFLGEQNEGVPSNNQRVGSQLTPPRQFMVQDAGILHSFESDSFFPLLATGKGGLGAGWGAACFTFNRNELQAAKLNPDELLPYYQKVADIIGVSADLGSPIYEKCYSSLSSSQPALQINSNASTILSRYESIRYKQPRFTLGKPCLALLSEPKENRSACTYSDMEFYSDSGHSVFRPQHLIESLKSAENFFYLPGHFVLEFLEDETGVTVTTSSLTGDQISQWRCRTLILASGAINTAKIVLKSFGLLNKTVPLLSNPYTYLPCINWATFGGSVQDSTHSLVQLFGYMNGETFEQDCTLQFYSYRSLLLFKLVKEFPLPAWAGLLLARTLVNSLTIIGIHHGASHSGQKTMKFDGNKLHFQYVEESGIARSQSKSETRINQFLLDLGLIPLKAISTGPAGSIHYGGTISQFDGAIRSTEDFRVEGCRRVWIGDSACFNYLPAKGLTFTIMAHAARVADQAARLIHD